MMWHDIWQSVSSPVTRALDLAERAVIAYEKRQNPENVLAKNIVQYAMLMDGTSLQEKYRTIVAMAHGAHK